MKTTLLLMILAVSISCSSSKTMTNEVDKTDFTLAFGSCNKQYVDNVLWKEVKKNNPNFIKLIFHLTCLFKCSVLCFVPFSRCF